MSRVFYQKPPVASWPTWKALLLALFVGGSITVLRWGFKALWEPGRYVGFHSDPPSFPPLTIGDILVGSGALIISFWNRWVWQRRRKHRHWYHWLGNFFSCMYISLVLLCGGMAFWNTLLVKPWNLLVNTVSIVLFMLMWVLPALSYTLAKRLVEIQYSFDLRLLKFGGPAALMIMTGILGANFGAHGSWDARMLVLAFLFSVLSIGLAQYFAAYLWRYRPWAKEDE